MWGLLRYCRGTARCAPLHAALDRALSGDADGDIGFRDHDEVYDGCADPPRPPAPAAVDAITRALLESDIDQVLAGLPDDPAAAASAVGFQGFRGDVCVYPVEHFLAPCAFFRGARLRGRCVIVWID
ncbi:DUF1877 domain-containing protein [Streptomyces mirabilis]|uniref:DUF1877 domain-containing protein n=1 Tax=Streptomyces mirabilis TaxID=68239 RepID=UPI00225C3DE1|nr:DUF1877 domain-containing protein [Streptomyces mirabilis]MCX4425777.1 DUF1877 domain-containing protein [Streptomyces mirabilis]